MRNPVERHMDTFCKPQTHKDRSKTLHRKRKHKGSEE